jgi:coenzyme F420-0:L-glutamate ligase/coenzyme F420-1:gamma-L-glutamate ligase
LKISRFCEHILTLTLTPLPGIPVVNPGDDLANLIQDGLNRAGVLLQEGDILVVAQKIISKSEGRAVNLANIIPSKKALDLAQIIDKDSRLTELILQESKSVLRTRPGTIIVEHRLGFVCANAGIDHSNVSESYDGEDWVLLLPEDPDASAIALREALEENSGESLGVLIIDSHGRAWRMGTAGVAIGLSGMPGLVDLRGEADLFGYTLQITQVGAADELAAAASLVMGQAAEGTPVVHARGFPYDLREGQMSELIRPEREDLFR